jgi:hypothetical protein
MRLIHANRSEAITCMNTTSSSIATHRHTPLTGDRALRALAVALALLGEGLVLATIWLWMVTGLIDEIDDLVRRGDVIFSFASCAVALLILQKHPRHRYNDAHIPILGSRHPSALARPAAEV